MANRYLERYSAPLTIREMQIKTTTRYHLTPIGIAIIKKTWKNKCWWGCGEKRTLLHCWWEYKLEQPLWKTVWKFLKKLKMELPYDLVIPLLGIYPKKIKSGSWKDNLHSMFTAAVVIIIQKWKKPNCLSMNEWIKKTWYIQERRTSILPFAKTWKELEGVTLSELSQREKDEYRMISLMCKKAELIETGSRMVVARVWWMRKWGDAGQRVQISS